MREHGSTLIGRIFYNFILYTWWDRVVAHSEVYEQVTYSVQCIRRITGMYVSQHGWYRSAIPSERERKRERERERERERRERDYTMWIVNTIQERSKRIRRKEKKKKIEWSIELNFNKYKWGEIK
jgi:hypothetical protein